MFAFVVLVVIGFGTMPETRAQTLPQPAADTASISAAPDLTTARIQAKIDEVDARKDIEQAQREQALALYRKALGELEAAGANQAAAAKFQDAISNSPAQTAELKQQLDAVLSATDETVRELAASVEQLPAADVSRDSTQRRQKLQN